MARKGRSRPRHRRLRRGGPTRPEIPIAYRNRGDARRDKGDLDGAIADYDAAIRLNPEYAYAYNNRGNAWYDKGDLDRAIADYDAAIRIDPKYAAVYRNRGNAWRRKGDSVRAIADYDEAIRLSAPQSKDGDVGAKHTP
jgi:tetratricopeptide (TPR) repeat protein